MGPYGELRYRSVAVSLAELLKTIGLLLNGLMPVCCNDLAVQKVLPVNHLADARLPVVPTELLQLKRFGRCGDLRIRIQNGTGDTVGVRIVFLRHILGNTEALGGLTIRGIDIVGSLASEILHEVRDNLVQDTQGVVLFIHTALACDQLLRPRLVLVDEVVVLRTEPTPICQRLASTLMAWDDMVIMVNGLLAEQAMSVLLCVYRILHGAQPVQRSLLVFPIDGYWDYPSP